MQENIIVVEKKTVATKIKWSFPKYCISILMERKQSRKQKSINKSRSRDTMYTCKLITMDLNTHIDY